MPLDALDHLILDRRMHAALGAAANTQELQQTLAKQAAANQGRKAIIDALVAAYNANDWPSIQATRLVACRRRLRSGSTKARRSGPACVRRCEARSIDR